MHDVVSIRPLPVAATGYGPARSGAIGPDPVPAIESLLPERLDSLALAEVLEEVDTGIVVCNENGRIVMANDAGRRELQRGRPLAADPGGALLVTGDGPGATAHCRAALRAAVHTRRRQLLALNDGNQRLMVAVTPLGQSGHPFAVVLVGRRQPAPDLAVEMLGKLCDLTHSERSVLVALLAGERVESVARRRGVKIATVRTQVGALRGKLGARRLEDLVRLAAGLPPMSGALRTPRMGGGWADAAPQAVSA